jgi:hypothetical protein
MTKIRISRNHNVVKIALDETMIVLPMHGDPARLADRYAKQVVYGLRERLKEAIKEHRQSMELVTNK